MLVANGAAVRAPREHPDTCYNRNSARSSIPRRRGEEYTLAQAREVVLIAVAWLHERGWAFPDRADLNQYGPALHNIDRMPLQRVLDDLVRTEDLEFTVRTPRRCRHSRPCYNLPQSHRRKVTSE